MLDVRCRAFPLAVSLLERRDPGWGRSRVFCILHSAFCIPWAVWGRPGGGLEAVWGRSHVVRLSFCG